MGFIEDITLVWENEIFLPVILFFVFLSIGIFFMILTISDIAERKTDGVFLTICLFFSLLTLFCHLNIYKNADCIREKALEKQKAIEEQQREYHISKMCFILDTSIKSDLKKDELQEKLIYALYKLANNYYFDLEKTQNAYYENNKTSDGFSDNKEFSKIYSLGYQNLLEIKKEIGNRRTYCFKNYCNDIYYNNSYDGIETQLEDYTKLQCNKGDKND